MTIPALLALRSNDNQVTSAKLVLYRDGSVSDFGIELPTPSGGGFAVDALFADSDDQGRVAFFKGSIYVAVDTSISNRGGVFRTSDFGQSWVQVLDTFDVLTQNLNSYLLHVINIRGEPTLCLAGWSGDLLVAKTTDGITWFSNTYDMGSAPGRVGNDLVVGTTLWLLGTASTSAQFGGRQYYTINFDGPINSSDNFFGEITKNDGLNDSYSCSAWCVFNGDVYLARPDTRGSSTTVNIWRLIPTGEGTAVSEGGISEIVATITHSGGNVGNNNTKWDMFTDGTNMYLFHWHNNDVWLCHQIDSSFVVTDIGATVLPEYMLDIVTDDMTDSSAAQVRVLTDKITDPSSPPSYYIYVNVNATQGNQGIPTTAVPWRIYQWNGNASTMTFVDEGGSLMDSINFNATKVNNKLPFFTVSRDTVKSPRITILDKEIQSDGKVKFQFEISAGVSGLQTISVRGYYNDPDTGDIDLSQATLENVSQGTIIGNTITGLSTGSIIYEVTWDAPTDGFADGDSFNFRFEARVA